MQRKNAYKFQITQFKWTIEHFMFAIRDMKQSQIFMGVYANFAQAKTPTSKAYHSPPTPALHLHFCATQAFTDN
jgi:hypothetical protein